MMIVFFNFFIFISIFYLKFIQYYLFCAGDDGAGVGGSTSSHSQVEDQGGKSDSNITKSSGDGGGRY